MSKRIRLAKGVATRSTTSLHHRTFRMRRTLSRARRSARWGDPYQPRARRGSGRHDPPHHRTPRHRARRPTERSELGCWPVGDGQHFLSIVGHTGPRSALAPHAPSGLAQRPGPNNQAGTARPRRGVPDQPRETPRDRHVDPGVGSAVFIRAPAAARPQTPWTDRTLSLRPCTWAIGKHNNIAVTIPRRWGHGLLRRRHDHHAVHHAHPQRHRVPHGRMQSRSSMSTNGEPHFCTQNSFHGPRRLTLRGAGSYWV